MEEAYSNLNNAYLQIKGMIVVEGFYALVAGFVITTFVFKLAGIIKEMVHEGKGFNAKQFYELGREYILCIALICIMPVLLDTLETVLAYAADRLMESLAAGGVYNPDNIWKKPIEQLFDDLMNSDIIDIAVNGLDTAFDSLLAGAVGSFGGVAYDYLMLVFLCTRYLILILLEVISPLAIACLYNSDTRQLLLHMGQTDGRVLHAVSGICHRQRVLGPDSGQLRTAEALVRGAHGDLLVHPETDNARDGKSNS